MTAPKMYVHFLQFFNIENVDLGEQGELVERASDPKIFSVLNSALEKLRASLKKISNVWDQDSTCRLSERTVKTPKTPK